MIAHREKSKRRHHKKTHTKDHKKDHTKDHKKDPKRSDKRKDKRSSRRPSKKDSFDRIPINDVDRINKSRRPYMPEGFNARVINKEPYIVKIKNFLRSEEVDELIEMANKKGFERSNMVIDNELIVSDYRTSQTSYILEDGMPGRYSDNIENLISRVCYLLDCKRSQMEGLMVVKYEEGCYFETHVDFFSTDDSQLLNDGGQRIATFFVYLNTLEKGDGGETEFPDLGVKSRPVKTDSVFWFNEIRGEMKRNTYHRGLPPKNGKFKIGLNVWIRYPGWE